MIVYVFGQKEWTRPEDKRPLFLACDFDELLGGLGFGRKLDHQVSATGYDAILIQRIESLLAFLAHIDQSRLAQNGKMMRDGGLSDVRLLDDLVDRERGAATQTHDLLAGLVGDGFGEQYSIYSSHIDNLRCVLYR